MFWRMNDRLTKLRSNIKNQIKLLTPILTNESSTELEVNSESNFLIYPTELSLSQNDKT